MSVRAWSEAAALTGLSDVEILSSAFDTALSARSVGLRLEIRASGSSRQPQLSIVIDGLGHRPGELTLRAESLKTTLGRMMGARELVTGDGAFDEGVYVQGWPPLVHALLDVDTRRAVLRFLQDRIDIPGSPIGRSVGAAATLVDGRLRVEMPSPGSAPPAHLADTLSGILAIARRMVRPADIAGRLASNLEREPLRDVRLHCLAVLVREYPGRPATLGALRAALGDSSLDVRIQAAKALGPEGEPILHQITMDDQASEDAQARAVRALGGRLSLETGVTALRQALRRRRLRLAEACVEALGRRGGAEVVDPLAAVLGIESGTLAEAAARALGTAGQPESEAPLVAALGHLDDTVKLAAAGALGRWGSAAAVAPLRHLESASRDKLCRQAAREAVAQIQYRLPGATPGQLSLAGGGSGQLSLARSEAGQLMLHDDEPPGGSDPDPGS